jgi:hypothetical protein
LGITLAGTGYMKADFAIWLSASLELLCSLTGHFGGCWILNHSPLKRPFMWAFDLAHPVADYECSHCGERLTVAPGPHGAECSWRRDEGTMTANSIPTTFLSYNCQA